MAQANEQQLRQLLQGRDQEISSLQIQLASAEQQLHKSAGTQGQLKGLEAELQRRAAEVQKRVKHLAATLRIDQDPQYAPIKYAGHEAGEFIFYQARHRLGWVFAITVLFLSRVGSPLCAGILCSLRNRVDRRKQATRRLSLQSEAMPALGD